MGPFSKRMRQALDTVRDLSPEHQDLLAAELMYHAQLLAQPPAKLSPEERAELDGGLAAARRGEFASDADVSAMYLRHGL